MMAINKMKQLCKCLMANVLTLLLLLSTPREVLKYPHP